MSMVLPKCLFKPQTHQAVTACPVCQSKGETIAQLRGYSRSTVLFPDIFSSNVFMTTLLTNWGEDSMLGVLHTEYDVLRVCLEKDVSIHCQAMGGIVLFLDNWKYA